MVFDFSNFKLLFNKKLLIQIYFILFIFLNIIDFLNIIPNDLDFFKKLLSWTLIGYVFYKVSITKILIGKRIKKYDLGLIFAFSLMSIVKSLILYLKINTINNSTFPVFHYFLNFLPNDSNFVIISFLIGFCLILVILVNLLIKNQVLRKSFLGSFNIDNDFFKIVFHYILGFIFLLFFSLIVFSFFMEWFALAVDSVILVFGIFYYLFIYISRHSKNKLSSLLGDISNSGNNFYSNLIEKFSNKKTFLIGASSLLTVHFLVDIGVYLIPYLFGIENSLYFKSLGLESHQSLFNLFNFTSSLLFADLKFFSGDLFLSFGIFLIYILNYFLIFSLMVLPFYIFYNNLNKKKIVFKKWFSIIFLSALFFNLILFFLPTVNTPLNIDSPNVSTIKGVDFYTSPVANSINSFELLLSIFIFFIILAFLVFRFNKYHFFYKKIIFISILLFFIFYIFIFFTSLLSDEIYSSNINFDKKFNSKFSSANYVLELNQKVFSGGGEIILFSQVYNVTNHNDFILYNFTDFDYSNYNLRVRNITLEDFDYRINADYQDLLKLKFDLKILDEQNNSWDIIYPAKDNFMIIKDLGKNYFSFKNSSTSYYLNKNFNKDLNFLYVEKIYDKPKAVYYVDIYYFVNNLRDYFLSMFYILGTFAFSWYFIKKNFFSSTL